MHSDPGGRNLGSCRCLDNHGNRGIEPPHRPLRSSRSHQVRRKNRPKVDNHLHIHEEPFQVHMGDTFQVDTLHQQPRALAVGWERHTPHRQVEQSSRLELGLRDGSQERQSLVLVALGLVLLVLLRLLE